MKKVLVMLVVGSLVASVSADLTEFRFKGGEAQDQGVAFDSWSLVILQGNNTSVSGLLAYTPETLQSMGLPNAGALETAKLPFNPTGTLTTEFITGDASLVGDVFGILVNRTGVTDIAQIVAGDWIGWTIDFGVIDLQPGGAGTPIGTAQDFSTGVVNADTQVVPEPATFGLMGVAALGLFLARKKARR